MQCGTRFIRQHMLCMKSHTIINIERAISSLNVLQNKSDMHRRCSTGVQKVLGCHGAGPLLDVGSRARFVLFRQVHACLTSFATSIRNEFFDRIPFMHPEKLPRVLNGFQSVFSQLLPGIAARCDGQNHSMPSAMPWRWVHGVRSSPDIRSSCTASRHFQLI